MRQQLTRRRFVQALGTGVGVLTLRPQCLQARTNGSRELEFLVVSDTHLGYRDSPAAAAAWRKTAVELAAAPGDFVLHLGDLVDRGLESQYPLYLESRQLIHKPVYEIPGNHDPLPLFQRFIRESVDYSFDHHWLRVLLLNNSRTDSHDGFLTAAQLAWLEERCADAKAREMLVLLAMHVPAHANKHPDRGWYVHPDQGQQELYALLARYAPQVVALFHGHFHNGLRGWNDHGTLHEICFPSALYNLDRQLERQQAPGYNPLEFRPGYARVRLAGGTMTVEYRPTGHEPSVHRDLTVVPQPRE